MGKGVVGLQDALRHGPLDVLLLAQVQDVDWGDVPDEGDAVPHDLLGLRQILHVVDAEGRDSGPHDVLPDPPGVPADVGAGILPQHLAAVTHVLGEVGKRELEELLVPQEVRRGHGVREGEPDDPPLAQLVNIPVVLKVN